MVKDLLDNHRVQGWFAARNSSASDTGIMTVVGANGMADARSIVQKAATKQLSPMLYDLPDIMTPYTRTPSAENIGEMKKSAVYQEIYNHFLAYFK